jgi:hypothetical protein
MSLFLATVLTVFQLLCACEVYNRPPCHAVDLEAQGKDAIEFPSCRTSPALPQFTTSGAPRGCAGIAPRGPISDRQVGPPIAVGQIIQ